MSLFSTKAPHERPLLDKPAKAIELPAWSVFALIGVLFILLVFYLGEVTERHSFAAKVDRVYAIKSALGAEAAKQYLHDHP